MKRLLDILTHRNTLSIYTTFSGVVGANVNTYLKEPLCPDSWIYASSQGALCGILVAWVGPPFFVLFSAATIATCPSYLLRNIDPNDESIWKATKNFTFPSHKKKVTELIKEPKRKEKSPSIIINK